MPSMTVIKNDNATLMYHPDDKIVHHAFHQPVTSEEFRQVLNTGAELFREHRASKWLSDDRGNTALSDEDSAWAQTDWFPRVQQAGWKFWALVVPEDMMARLNLKQFVDDYFERGLRIMVFTDPDKGMEWLKQQ